MEEMTSIIFDKDRLLSRICKLSPKKGDIILFQLKTDEQGFPIVSYDAANQMFQWLQELMGDGIHFLFTVDKIGYFCIKNSEECIKFLEEGISFIKKANEKALDIENENSNQNFGENKL